jgi:N-methylhydantoinase A
MYEGRIVGLPVQTPWVDVRSIGAGGGSLAWIDVGGLLRVGPGSAGADPGPACYERGGTQPTVTDAAFLLGMLGEGVLARGIRLGREAARAAMAPLAEQLGFELDEVARGIITIAASNMANAIREITVEQGQDPRRATLVAFGGAGPLFGTLLARELELQRIVVPPHAGNFSAWGLLGADLTQSAARTRITKLASGTVDDANDIVAGLFDSVAARAASTNGAFGAVREVAADMRYAGQEHTITIALTCDEDGRITASLADIRAAFTREYAKTFGHEMDEDVEIVSLRATLRTPLPRRASEHPQVISTGLRCGSRGDAYSFTLGEWASFRILRRDRLGPGTTVVGPAIILEETATTYLDADFGATVGRTGALLITDTRERS